MDTLSDHSIDMEHPKLPLATSIMKQIHDLAPISPGVCIFRVPPILRQVNEKAYTPRVVSIGPLHRKDKKLQPMEVVKVRYLKAFLDRSGMSLEDCIMKIKGWEERARNNYAEQIDLDSDEFAKMILLDSCFILEAIWRSAHGVFEKKSFYFTDMILLENQLPFFVLDGLFKLGFSKRDSVTFVELSIMYFTDLVLVQDSEKLSIDVMHYLKSGPEVKHFADLLRICHLPSAPRRTSGSNDGFIPIPKAADLDKAGMNLYKVSSHFLLDIRCDKGRLDIPAISIQDHSEYLLMNLVALEMCCYYFDSYIIDYIFFMDELIDSAEDVDLLVQKGIIKNLIGDSSKVAALFNNIGKEVSLQASNYYFNNISKTLNEHYDAPWNKWKAAFKRDYCSTPWMIASTVAAVILLVLTFIQTIGTVIPII